METKIDSLQALRRRKQQIGEQLTQSERQIKQSFYLYTHPVEFITNALTGRNLPATSKKIMKLATASSRIVRYGKIAYSVIKFLRKI